MLLWLLFALGTAFFWGIGQVLSKKGFEHISSLWSNIFAVSIGLLIYIPLALIGSTYHIIFPSVSILLLIFLTDICYLSYYYAISKGKLALTGTVFEIYPLFTIILSYIFLGERIALIQEFGILIIIISILFLVWPDKNDTKTFHDYSWIFWGLFGALLEGIGDFFAKIEVNAIGIYSQLFFFIVLFPLVLLANYLLDRKGRKLPRLSIKTFLPSMLGTMFIVIGTISLFFAFQYGKASLVTPLASSSPAIMVILAIIFLKEKITKLQILGIVGAILGVILVGI